MNFKVSRIGFIIASLIIVLDQLSKWVIITHVMNPARVIAVMPFFNLVLTWNKGVSFGMFNSGTHIMIWILTLVPILVVIVLSVWLLYTTQKFAASAIGLIIGGAIGNIIDRSRFGAVIDFLQLYLGDYYWPAFNVADSAICIGAGMLLFENFYPKRTVKL